MIKLIAVDLIQIFKFTLNQNAQSISIFSTVNLQNGKVYNAKYTILQFPFHSFRICLHKLELFSFQFFLQLFFKYSRTTQKKKKIIFSINSFQKFQSQNDCFILTENDKSTPKIHRLLFRNCFISSPQFLLFYLRREF